MSECYRIDHRISCYFHGYPPSEACYIAPIHLMSCTLDPPDMSREAMLAILKRGQPSISELEAAYER